MEAKGSTEPFGNVNIILAGDFAQLPPVGQTKLYSQVSIVNTGTKHGQQIIFGKLLWLSVKTVMILRQVMCQQGDSNHKFVDQLSHLRVGKRTEANYELLNTRLISRALPSWDLELRDAPIIVSDNDVKDALNVEASIAFAHGTHQTLHLYHCIYSRKGRAISDDDLWEQLLNLHSGKTNQRLESVPLVSGMPVMISQNFDVNAGILNGCVGVLKRI
jgi:hypothetical protein